MPQTLILVAKTDNQYFDDFKFKEYKNMVGKKSSVGEKLLDF